MRNFSFGKQGGALLLESLVAIGIFSFGLLGMVAMQAGAIKHVGDAKLRADASYLSEQIISQMRVKSNHVNYKYHETGTGCAFTGTAAGAEVAAWLGDAAKKDSVFGSLPNAVAQIQIDTSVPAVTVPITPAVTFVTVTVCWRAPQETATHNFTTSAMIPQISS
jgi:type IV pilus assembly protein PilV